MTEVRTIQRDGWLLTFERKASTDTATVKIGRSELSDWLEIDVGDVEQLVRDLREFAPKPRTIAQALLEAYPGNPEAAPQ